MDPKLTANAPENHVPTKAYARQLLMAAVKVVGSRWELSRVSGISRRRIQYIEHNNMDTMKPGRAVTGRLSYPEQFLLEHLVAGTKR